jgi:hypothetical protein
LTAISLEPASPTANAPAKIRALVVNFGNSSISALAVRIGVRPAGSPSASFQWLGEGKIDVGGGNQSASFEVEWLPAAAGEYDIRAEINMDGAYPASAVLNDHATIRVSVSREAPAASASGDLSGLILLVGAFAALAVAMIVRRHRR